MTIWSCKIGEVDRDCLPEGADLPMRQAIERAYREVTGQNATFIFSGWGASLTAVERDCVDCTCRTFPHQSACAVNDK